MQIRSLIRLMLLCAMALLFPLTAGAEELAGTVEDPFFGQVALMGGSGESCAEGWRRGVRLEYQPFDAEVCWQVQGGVLILRTPLGEESQSVAGYASWNLGWPERAR